MINIACVLRQGGKVGYDAEWVAKLKRAVERNTTHPHRFVCLSDCDVPCERLPLEPTGKGFWSKIQLFRPGQFDGPVLYIDLDTVICSSIDPIIDRIYHRDFVMWHEADKNVHSSALMWWKNDHSDLWNLYLQDPGRWAGKYSKGHLYGDQGFICEHVAHSLLTDHCPANWFHIASRRDDEKTDFSSIKILMFRKSSHKPSTMLAHPLVKAHWV